MDFFNLTGIFASPWDVVRSLVDIIIVSYIFYRLLGLIQNSRAEQLLKGVIVLLLFSAGATVLQLDLLNWLLDKFWLVLAIALPIVFQPELRRILEQLGQGKFLKTYYGSSSPDTNRLLIHEIITAAKLMARDKIGALMVLARDTDIEEYLDSGTRMDAVVSAGLLINIFVPNTPLHDGAVVIKHGRIQSAACFLPLSSNPALDPKLGTRHRAGLGITEVSDAIAVIVSEETGTISVARAGRLVRYLDEKSLQEILEMELVTPAEPPERVWKRRMAHGRKDGEK
ncbi:MAG TPA: diadenylate cyclase CdaA [Syntrophomonadaceae bacterium]|nr:diadenylate cyclase CdaA [Syntrophomonadaceae bacterium]